MDTFQEKILRKKSLDNVLSITIIFLLCELNLLLIQTMKIVQILETFHPYEWEISSYAWEFAKNFIAEKHWGVVNLVLFHPDTEKRKGYDLDWYRVIFLPTVKVWNSYILKFWSKEYRDCFKRIREWNPDTIHTHSRSFLVAMIWLCCSLKWNKKWVFFEHSAWRRSALWWWQSLKRKIYNRSFWKLTLSFCNDIIVMNSLSVNYLKKFTNKKINLIYRWCDFPIVKKVNRNDFIIKMCFISDIVKSSWIWTLFKAYVELVKTHPNIMLDIIWDGEEKEELENLIVKFWLSDWMKTLGKISKEDLWNKYLPTYDIVVSPSLDNEELIEEPILWWLLSKTLVIATNIWAVKEITDMEDLILVPAGDVNALIAAVERAIWKLDKSWMSYDIVKEKFSWKKNLDTYLDVCYP